MGYEYQRFGWRILFISVCVFILIIVAITVNLYRESFMKDNTKQDIQAIVQKYIMDNKGWNDTDYRIEILNQFDVSTQYKVNVIHQQDEAVIGAKQSIQLHVDVQKKQVIKELAFQ